MYVLVSPCILDPSLRARGITTDEDRRWYEKAAARCRRFGIGMVPLPCPETLFFGTDREPGPLSGRLDTQEFSKHLEDCEGEARAVIAERGAPFCIIGVDSSPTCGVTHHHYGSKETGDLKRKGRGLFLDRLRELPAIEVSDFARYRVYLAAPLFSEAERDYNARVAGLLSRHFFEVYLPQDSGEDTGERTREAQREMFDGHCRALDDADYVVAVIDGADADSGTSWEMGYAHARGIPVVALRTDFRTAGRNEQVNFMLEHSATVVRTTGELISTLMPYSPADRCG